MSAFSAEDLCRHTGLMRALARDLLADEARADDAVQQAYLVALTRPPRARVALGSWLARVVRSCALDQWRAQERAERRERIAARPEGGEPDATAKQFELQEDLVAALRSLDDAHRTVVWLRYFEGRTPSEIAAHLGVPVKTIKTRLWRALQQLRRRLDSRYGDRQAWLGALVPLAGSSRGTEGPIAAAAAGAVLMQGKNLMAAAGLLVLLVGGAVWWLVGGAAAPKAAVAPPSPVGEELAVAPDRDRAEGSARLEVEGAPADASEAADSPAVLAPYGGLLVRVRWHDGEPAADVALALIAEAEPQLDRNELRVVSDSTGVARVERLHAGPVSIHSDRSGSGGALRTEVVAGEVRRVDLALPRGFDATGVVLDERGLPIAEALVTLVSPRSGWLGSRVVASTGADGTFAVRALDADWSLGALAEGYAPSELVDLETLGALDDGRFFVELRLVTAGGAVAGRVVDESGLAIAGAEVVLGRGGGTRQQDGRTRELWGPRVVTADADGHFRYGGVASGKQRIGARAAGYARVASEVHCVAGETASVELTLRRGVSVHGTVRDGDGSAVEGAVVVALDGAVEDVPVSFAITLEASEWKRPRTLSDALGSFRLEGVAPGDLHLVAAKPRGMGQYEGVDTTTMTARPGDVLLWDPRLESAQTLRVQVLDANGEPGFLGRLEAFAEQPAGAATQLTAFPEQEPMGLFVFTECADVPYTVAARVPGAGVGAGDGSGWLYRSGVRPGDEVELYLPPSAEPGPAGRVRGRIVDRGERLRGRPLQVTLCTRSTRRHLEVDGEVFLAREVEPDRYYITASAGDENVLVGPWFELEPAQRVDLGELVTEAGANVRVSVHAPQGALLGTPSARLRDGPRSRKLVWDGSVLVAENVNPGTHRVVLQTKGWHAPPLDVELEAGRDHEYQLEVVPGALRRFELVLPPAGEWQECDLSFRDERGQILADKRGLTFAGSGPRPILWNAHLPFAKIELHAVIDGRERRWPLDLRDASELDELRRLSLRE